MIYDLLKQLNRAKYFREIDLNSGYQQVPIDPTDVWKTPFKSKEDIFQWLVMHFKFTNVPATFMRLIDDILWSFTNSFIIFYLNDILIFSKSWEEYLQHIRQVVQTLQQQKLCAKLEKFTFGMSQVQYMVYIIDEHGVHVDLAKIQVFWDWPSLATLTELCIFLGLEIFYQGFMLGFSRITWPLCKLTKGREKEKFSWFGSQQKVFVELKRCLCSAPILTLPDLQ